MRLPALKLKSSYAVQDLNIDLHGLAASLSNLPVWTVLDLDASLCQTFLPVAGQSESGNQTHDNKAAQHHLHASTADVASDADANISLSTRDTLPQASQEPGARHTEDAKPIRQQQRENTSAPAPANTQKMIDDSKGTTAALVMPATQTQAGALQQDAKPSVQEGMPAPAGEMDNLDLDELLNIPDASTKPQAASTAVVKPASQDQDSLEDWLNSL